MKIVAFVPIKFYSQRLSNKNFLLLDNKPLCSHIFDTLNKVDRIDEIYVYCSNSKIINNIPNNVNFLQRSNQLDSNETLGIELYQDFCSTVDADIYILAHATSPFISVNSINKGIDSILIDNYNSSLSVKQVNNFVWYQGKPLNYSINHIPRTQTIEPIYIETSGFYIFKQEVITKLNTRIGDNPYLVIVDNKEGTDIDTEEDFVTAQYMIG